MSAPTDSLIASNCQLGQQQIDCGCATYLSRHNFYEKSVFFVNKCQLNWLNLLFKWQSNSDIVVKIDLLKKFSVNLCKRAVQMENNSDKFDWNSRKKRKKFPRFWYEFIHQYFEKLFEKKFALEYLSFVRCWNVDTSYSLIFDTNACYPIVSSKQASLIIIIMVCACAFQTVYVCVISVCMNVYVYVCESVIFMHEWTCGWSI